MYIHYKMKWMIYKLYFAVKYIINNNNNKYGVVLPNII